MSSVSIMIHRVKSIRIKESPIRCKHCWLDIIITDDDCQVYEVTAFGIADTYPTIVTDAAPASEAPTKPINLIEPTYVTCPDCGGLGYKSVSDHTQTCSTCGGDGHIVEQRKTGIVEHKESNNA